jgi:hypothetical protein
MRFARRDVGDHVVSCKNGHRASYPRYGVLQWRSRLKINVCEIFGVVQFSTFATNRPNAAVRVGGYFAVPGGANGVESLADFLSF